MRRTIASRAPWIVHGVVIALLEARALGDGLPFIAALGVAWTVALVPIRAITAAARSRHERLFWNILFGALCFLFGWEGGVFLLPALGAFAIADLFDPTTPPYPFVIPMRGRGPIVLVLVVLVALAVAIGVGGPLYSGATSTAAPAAAPT